MKTTFTPSAAVFLALALLFLSGSAEAQKKGYLPESPTPNEFKVLPPYCFARIKGDAASKKSWQDQMGRDIFMHVHHYCSGLNYMNRAKLEMDRQKRNYYLQRASANFAYVIRAWPPTYSLTSQAKKLKTQADSLQSRK